jgi:hypothetical protein
MKKKMFLAGMPGVALAFGLVPAGCPTDDEKEVKASWRPELVPDDHATESGHKKGE